LIFSASTSDTPDSSANVGHAFTAAVTASAQRLIIGLESRRHYWWHHIVCWRESISAMVIIIHSVDQAKISLMIIVIVYCAKNRR